MKQATICREDVYDVAKTINMDITYIIANKVLDQYDAAQAEDSGATWNLVVEMLLYEIKTQMKIGFDVHGVLDYAHNCYVELARTLAQSNHEIYILTGSRRETFNKKNYNILKGVGFKFFSISDHIAKYYPDKIDLSDPDNPKVKDKKLWDSQKGEYARMHNLDLVFEDNPDYLQYFTTPVVLVQNNKTIGLIK